MFRAAMTTVVLLGVTSAGAEPIPTPHVRPADGYPLPAPQTARGGGQIVQSFTFSSETDGITCLVTMTGEDLDGDGVIMGSGGYYAPPSAEVIDLYVTFWEAGARAAAYDNANVDTFDYPYFYFEWPLGADAPTSWDIGADPGWYSFGGPAVTPSPGAWFFDSSTFSGGLFSSLERSDPLFVASIGSVERTLTVSAVADGMDELPGDPPDCIILCTDFQSDTIDFNDDGRWEAEVSAFAACGSCDFGTADAVLTVDSVVDNDYIAARGRSVVGTSGPGSGTGQFQTVAELECDELAVVTFDLVGVSSGSLITLTGPGSSQTIPPGVKSERLLEPGDYTLDLRVHVGGNGIFSYAVHIGLPPILREDRQRGYETIQAAIDDGPGAYLLLGPGTYIESLVANAEQQTLYLQGSAGAEWTVLEPPSFGGLLSLTGVSAQLQGVCLRDGQTLVVASAADLQVDACIFELFVDGAINADESSLQIKDCIFRAGSTLFTAIPVISSTQPADPHFTITNSLFHDITGTIGMPILGLEDMTSADVLNCTFADNVAKEGSAIRYSADATINVSNCIFWNEFLNPFDGPMPPNVQYSILPGGTGTNIDADPLFRNASGEDYRLSRGSPAIDAGDNSVWPSVSPFTRDVLGQTRFMDDFYTPDTGAGVRPVVDIGATEYQGDLLFVPDDHATIQAAIDAAEDGQSVVIRWGLYRELVNLRGKAIALRSEDPASPFYSEGTTIFGDLDLDDLGDGTVVSCVSGEGPTTLIDGLTIRRGSGTFGGGMRIASSGPIIRRCRFVENVGDFGAAVSQSDSSAYFESCTFFDNTSTTSNGGGAAWNENSTPTFTNCLIHDNTVGGSGAAFTDINSNPTLIGCTIADNSGGLGAIFDFGNSSATVINTILWNPASNSEIFSGAMPPTVAYSLIRGGAAGPGNVSGDPQFTGGFRPYQLDMDSPAIDAGDNSAAPPEVTIDLSGQPRFRNDTFVPDSGSGTAPIIDIGAYERQPTFNPACRADINGSGVVDFTDLNEILDHWGESSPAPGDIDFSGVVDFGDLNELLDHWAEICQ